MPGLPEWIATGLRQVSALIEIGDVRRAQSIARGMQARAAEQRRPQVVEAQATIRMPFPLDARVAGCPLGSGVCVSMCLARQKAGDPRPKDPDRDPELARHDGKRGTAPEEGSCSSKHCSVGRSVREANAVPVVLVASGKRRKKRSAADYLRR